MKAVIYYSGKYGSTRQYAEWLQQQTGFPAFDVREPYPDPAGFDLLVLGSSIFVGTPTLKKWLFRNWEAIRHKPALLFTVSGTEPGHPNLITWLNMHLSPEMLAHLKYVPLRGRMDPLALPWWVRVMLRLAGHMTADPEEAKRMSEGFDYMDRDSLEPIAAWISLQQGAGKPEQPARRPRQEPEPMAV